MDTGILPPQLKSIEQLFTGDARYSVPLYQRSFAWTHDEVEELWDDITAAAARGNSEYFLGTIVLQKTDTNEYEIIDGQQRLACLTMIFSAIRRFYTNVNDERAEQVRNSFLGAKDFSKGALIKPKLILNRIDNEIFVQYIIQSETIESVKSNLRSRRNKSSHKLLLEAYQFFLEKITTEASKYDADFDKFIVPLIDCLRSSLKLITITVLSGEDANLFFESLNARGKELAVSDLVKNRLFIDAADQITRAQQLWDNVESTLNRKSIPEYLRHFWIAKRASTSNLIVREKQLYRLIADETKNNKAAAINLLRELEQEATYYVTINDISLWAEDITGDTTLEESIDDLLLFRVTQCNPLLLNAIRAFQQPKDIAKVFRIVANFSFRYFVIGNQSPGNLERETNNIAVGIRTGLLASPNAIADAFRAINPDNSFYGDLSAATVSKSRAKIARYILAKINNHMSTRLGPQGKEQVVNPNAKQVNLEHILPQSLPLAWRSSFSQGVDIEDYVYRIGNLTLLTRKVNSDAGDTSFAEKKITLSNSTLPLNEPFKAMDKWTEIEIERRQSEMAKLSLEVWRI
jgi:uncharacterized protein with ParB-like and HNH nuclease domain